MLRYRAFRAVSLASLIGIAVLGSLSNEPVDAMEPQRLSVLHRVVVPLEDRFDPFALTIRAGDIVQWVNGDTDDHTVVADTIFTTTDHASVNHLIPGTDNNNGQPGRFALRFVRPGVFVYYCRFHAHLDDSQQPVAPGPDGGIQDANGNFGTPMSGVITVLPASD